MCSRCQLGCIRGNFLAIGLALTLLGVADKVKPTDAKGFVCRQAAISSRMICNILIGTVRYCARATDQ